MPKTLVNGIHLHYYQAGEASDLVMIHGLGANLAFWYPRIVKAFASDYRVTVYDLRGHGNSDMPSSGYTSADMAHDLKGLMDKLGIVKAHLVGHSFGGTVALHYAVLYSDRVSSLTLTDAIVRALQSSQRAKNWPYWDVWMRKLEKLGIYFSDKGQDLDFSLLERLSDPGLQSVRARFRKEGLFLPFGAFGGNRRSATRFQQLLKNTSMKKEIKLLAGLTRQKISQIKHPVLAVYGERSFCLDSCYGLKSLLPECKTIIIQGAGHFHPVVRPNLFIDALRRFLSAI